MSDTRDHPMANAMNRPFVPQPVFLRIHIYSNDFNQQQQQQTATMNEQAATTESNETSTSQTSTVDPRSFIDASIIQSMLIPVLQFNHQNHSTSNTATDTDTTSPQSSPQSPQSPPHNHQMPLFIIPWFSSGIGNDGRHYFSPFMSGEWQNINQDGWSMTGHPPAATKAMQALPVRLPPNYANNKASPHNDDPTITNNEESIEDCAVCQDPLFASNTVSTEDTKEGDAKEATTVREMPCGHAFHEACLFPWLRRSNTCPCCRWELDTDNVDYNRVIHRRRSERLAQMGKLPCKLVEYQYCNHCDTTTINNNSENTSKTLEEPVAVPKESNDTKDGVTSTPEMIVLPECGCGFHRDCLSEFLRSVYNMDLNNSNSNNVTASSTTALYCPACHQHQEIATKQLIA